MNGICYICGTETKLTFEHIPPRSAGNNKPMRVMSFDPDKIANVKNLSQKKSEDFTENKYKQLQRGLGRHVLCSDCNRMLGHNFVKEYKYFYEEITSLLLSNIDEEIEGVMLPCNDSEQFIRIIKFYKQCFSMVLCNLNSPFEEDLREFFSKNNLELNVESIDYDLLIGIIHPKSKFLNRVSGEIISVTTDLKTNKQIFIDVFPFKVVFYERGKYKGDKYYNFSQFKYTEKDNGLNIYIPLSFSDNPLPIIDNRSAEEIENISKTENKQT